MKRLTSLAATSAMILCIAVAHGQNLETIIRNTIDQRTFRNRSGRNSMTCEQRFRPESDSPAHFAAGLSSQSTLTMTQRPLNFAMCR